MSSRKESGLAMRDTVEEGLCQTLAGHTRSDQKVRLLFGFRGIPRVDLYNFRCIAFISGL